MIDVVRLGVLLPSFLHTGRPTAVQQNQSFEFIPHRCYNNPNDVGKRVRESDQSSPGLKIWAAKRGYSILMVHDSGLGYLALSLAICRKRAGSDAIPDVGNTPPPP